MAQGVVRAGEAAVPGGSYMLKQLPMPMVGLSEQVLFSPSLDGTARIPVVNDSDVGLSMKWSMNLSMKSRHRPGLLRVHAHDAVQHMVKAPIYPNFPGHDSS